MPGKKTKDEKRRPASGSTQGESSRPAASSASSSEQESPNVQTIPLGSPMPPATLRERKREAQQIQPPVTEAVVTAEQEDEDTGEDQAETPERESVERSLTVATNFMGAGSQRVEGKERRFSDLTVEELVQFAPTPGRPSWMVTRFPVSLEEYRALEVAARQPDMQRAVAPMGASPDTVIVDAGQATTLVDDDIPEGETAPTGPAGMAPGLTANFAGIGQTAWQPPDNALAVGPNHVLVAVNTDLAGYSKAGAFLFRWPNMTTLFSPVLPADAQLFDPQLAYDHYANRWIVVIAARRAAPAGSWLMVAVSQGPDPAGAYWVWALDATLDGSTATNNWADFPMLGIDTQAIYISSNMFQLNGGFQYAKLRILNKAELYAGGVGANHFISWYDFWNLRNPDNSFAFTVAPAKHFRGTGGNPPAYLVNSLWPSGSTLTMWTLNSPIAFWSGGAPSLSNIAINCRSYELPPDALQSGSATRIETNDVRCMHAVFQHVGGTRRLWTALTSRFTWSGDSEARSVVQFYEIDVPTNAIAQQNAFGASGRYYFFPVIQTDINRNAYVLFGRAAADEFGHLRQTGRRVTDAMNTLQGSATVAAGLGSYTGGRWGDYFGICRDGGDSSTVWMYGEYAGTGNTWATQVCAARF